MWRPQIYTRETIEGWPLLTGEAKANKGVHMNGVFPWLVDWACHASTRDLCPILSALVETISLHLSLSSSKLGRQSCQCACLLICVTGI